MRSRSTHGRMFSARLADGKLGFQCCEECGGLQYPPAEICRRCLSDQFTWRTGEFHGEIVASVQVHRSYAEDFKDGGPWWVASVKLDDGPVCYAHALGRLAKGTRVQLIALRDRLGDGVIGVVTHTDETRDLQARFA